MEQTSGNTVLHSSNASEQAWRVRIALNLKNIQYEKKVIDEKTPMQLEIDGKTLSEGNSIMEYLEESFPDTKNLLPKGQDKEACFKRYQVRSLCETIHSGPGTKDSIEQGLSKFETVIKDTKGKYSVGDEVTLADVVLVPQAYQAKKNGVSIESLYPGISSILTALEEIQEFSSAHADSQEDAQKPSGATSDLEKQNKVTPDETIKEAEKPKTWCQMFVSGIISNSIALALLFCVAHFLDLYKYVFVALGMQWAVYIFHGLPFQSEKFYDLSGSVTHFAVVVASLVSSDASKSPRQICVALASVIWMTRLGSFLFLRIEKDGRDARFDEFKICFLSWMGVWTLQATWVTLIQLPILLINERDDSSEYTLKDWITFSIFIILWIVGFICESAADNEKFVFKCRAANKGKWIQSGIWRFSRHPNYFGEILMWMSLAVLVICKDFKDGQMYGALVSPGFTMLLLLGVSGIPMVEASGEKRWGKIEEYKAYMKHTSALIPWIPYVKKSS